MYSVSQKKFIEEIGEVGIFLNTPSFSMDSRLTVISKFQNFEFPQLDNKLI